MIQGEPHCKRAPISTKEASQQLRHVLYISMFSLLHVTPSVLFHLRRYQYPHNSLHLIRLLSRPSQYGSLPFAIMSMPFFGTHATVMRDTDEEPAGETTHC